MESDSGSSVIMLSDDNDDGDSVILEDDEQKVDIDEDVEENTRTIKMKYEGEKAFGVDSMLKHDKLVRPSSLLKKSKVTNNVGSGQFSSKLGDGDSDDEEDRVFEKNFQHDFNFVHAKFLVKKKVGFVCDVNSNLDPVERKVKKLMEQADIIILKKCLDAGGDGVLPSYLDSKIVSKPKPTPASNNGKPEPTIPITVNKSRVENPEFSDDDSPLREQDLKKVGATAPQMPVVDIGGLEVPDLLGKKKERDEFKSRQYKPKPLKKEKSRTIQKLLKSAVVFPSIKSKSFKIPRAVKARPARWISNGALWRWALTVDDNGQYSR